MSKFFIFTLVICILTAGCESLDVDTSALDEETSEVSTDDTSSTDSETTDSESSDTTTSAYSDEPIDLSTVEWLHSDVSGWSRTASLSVTISSSTITLDYDKASDWPGVDVNGTSLNANPWIFVYQGGVWYAATFEWLRPGQTSKPTYTVAGDHIKVSPLDNFSPVSGTQYGFMVSGLARTSTRNVEERSNVVMATWP